MTEHSHHHARLTIARNCHPLVREFVRAMKTQGRSYRDVSRRSGVDDRTLADWSKRCNPTLANFQAALNALGLELHIRIKCPSADKSTQSAQDKNADKSTQSAHDMYVETFTQPAHESGKFQP